MPWSRPRDLLATATAAPDVTFFLGTCRPDGRPHAAGIGVVWFDGHLDFTSGPGTCKAKNLAADPRCTLSARMPGIDVVFEARRRG